jgi:hypothetical protein
MRDLVQCVPETRELPLQHPSSEGCHSGGRQLPSAHQHFQQQNHRLAAPDEPVQSIQMELCNDLLMAWQLRVLLCLLLV